MRSVYKAAELDSVATEVGAEQQCMCTHCHMACHRHYSAATISREQLSDGPQQQLTTNLTCEFMKLAHTRFITHMALESRIRCRQVVCVSDRFSSLCAVCGLSVAQMSDCAS